MSGERFGELALKLSALAARLLGWRPDDFWAATPAELTTILAPHAESGGDQPLTRADLARMMENDHG